MAKAAKIFQMIVRLTGLLQILMGIGLWMGHGLSLAPLHMWIGLVLVLSLWILAFLGARARVGGGLVALSLIWGAITVVFGMTQARILPGAQHELIRALHLLVGLGAITFAECLGKRIKKTGAPG
jgi:hypothetical protein